MSRPESPIRLTPGKRVLFLTKDPQLIRAQLRGELDLRMADLQLDELLDDVNTDAMTPAWACFDYKPEDIARNAYAGISVDGERLFPEGALADGGFEVIVSGYRKGVGSSRETAVQAEKWSGIRIAIAASFAPIHARNNITQGVLMGDHGMLVRLQAGEGIPLAEFTRGYDVITQKVIEHGGLFAFTASFAKGEVQLPSVAREPRAMNIAEKILARHVASPGGAAAVQPGDAISVRVDGGYSHEFTTAQVHYFLENEYGADYQVPNPAKFAVFEDHLIYAETLPKMAAFAPKIETLREMQRVFQKHTGVLDYSARDGISPGICHTVARERFIEPGDFIQATDSHTCMGGALNALAYGVGATEYAALLRNGITFVEVPESIRFELHGELQPGVAAKDVMLYILANHAKRSRRSTASWSSAGRGLLRCRRTSARRSPTWRPSAPPRPAWSRPTKRCCAGWSSAARAPRSKRCAPRWWRPIPVRSTRAACTSSTSPRCGRWSRRQAIRKPAYRPTRRTAPTSRISARCPSTSPTAARAPPARRTTSTCTRA